MKCIKCGAQVKLVEAWAADETFGKGLAGIKVECTACEKSFYDYFGIDDVLYLGKEMNRMREF